MLTMTEILAQLRANATGEAVNTSASVEVPQAAEAVSDSRVRQKATRAPATRDVPSCELRIGKTVVRYEIDDLDPDHPRWVWRITAGDTVRSGVLGNPLAPADLAHELTGLGPVVRNAPPTALGNTDKQISTRSR